MSTNDSSSGVSNCYVFKSRLQEYAQKVGLATPVYETVREGPSHEPLFRSTVIFNKVRYNSLLGFTNRKASEQSAAEVALTELAKLGQMDQSISQPVHETGLCKNLLQEYAQKMNYAIPTYECRKEERPGRAHFFSCAVQIGDIRYIGAAAKTKKEAEIKAARTALLAIQSSGGGFSERPDGNSQLTVIPCKRKAIESGSNREEVAKAPKPKKCRFKKVRLNRKSHWRKVGVAENLGLLAGNTDAQTRSEVEQSHAYGTQGVNSGRLVVETVGTLKDERINTNQNVTEISASGEVFVPTSEGYFQNGLAMASNFSRTDHGNADSVISTMLQVEYLAPLVNEVNGAYGVGQAALLVTNATVDQREASSFMEGLNQTADGSYAGVNQ